MLPQRFKLLRPYLAAWLQPDQSRPPLAELLHYFCRPSKQNRAARYIEGLQDIGDYFAINFKGFAQPFYYRKDCSWIDLCATVDECFNRANWHHYFSDHTPVLEDDVVIDCGAAEGLFTFISAQKAKKVVAFEPLPKFVTALQ